MTAIPLAILEQAGQTIALCVLRWIYSQASEILEILKAILLAAIMFIDAQIVWLKALLAQFDIISKLEETAWLIFKTLVDEIRDTLLNLPGNLPLGSLCPQFYELITDPLVQLSDINMSALTIWRERYKTTVSYMDEVEAALQYWETIKADLLLTVDVIDDALYLALINNP